MNRGPRTAGQTAKVPADSPRGQRPGRAPGAAHAHSHPFSSANLTASARLRASSFCIADERRLRTVPRRQEQGSRKLGQGGVAAGRREHLVLPRSQWALSLAESSRGQAGIDDSLAGDRARGIVTASRKPRSG